MNLSRPFIARPIATTLLSAGIVLGGIFAFFKLPVSPLPQVDFPTISVEASLPGASPEVVATSVTSPLERRLGQINGVTEMSSVSSSGAAQIILQFELKRNIDSAARDVQAAINAARADLPSHLKRNPSYNKVNPADTPVLILALTSPTLTRSQLYDSAATVLQQALSQIPGIGEVAVSGSANPAVRVELNPHALFKYGIGLETVRTALSAANQNLPKGALEYGAQRYQLYTNDQATQASQYRNLIIAYRNGAAVRLADIGQVSNATENVRTLGLLNNEPAVLVILYRQPGANVIDTVDRVKAILPKLQAALPAAVNITPIADRTKTIRASLKDAGYTLAIAVGLVIFVVFAFLRNARATLIPCLAVPISIIGTFSAMYLLGYSLDNLSLMALTIAAGFVVDDAIVVLENISRHIEAGKSPLRAALAGAREVSFTVLSISISLVAVFLPILLMDGIVGRIFREFALTLSLTIGMSLFVSLTLTPMLCSRFLRARPKEPVAQSMLQKRMQGFLDALPRSYRRSLNWSLEHPKLIGVVLLTTIALNIYLYITIPKGFFPQQDTGLLVGSIRADQNISFQLMKTKLAQSMEIIKADPAVETIAGFIGARRANSSFMSISLKPRAERQLTAAQVIERLRPKLNAVPGSQLFLAASQDIRIGGRQSNAQYQFTLLGESSAELYRWGQKLTEALQRKSELIDVNNDLQQKGLENKIIIDYASAARFGITPAQIGNTLYDAFGQRQVSTIYNALNQYHVVMELAPRYTQHPEALKDIYFNATNHSAAQTMVPLSAFAHYEPGHTPLAVFHQGLFAAVTLSFNLPADKSLSDAAIVINHTMNEIGMPASIHGSFEGTAKVFQKSLANQPLLILAALAAVYIVLGILYESTIHPLTILSTLPSAGVGALLALLLFRTEFSLIALIAVTLLIGIVMKNAIIMVDFALAATRRGSRPREAIFNACLLRFRPIMMTTCAAMLGALPLVLGQGEGSELRRPLGISIVGGLFVSQILTLYTTPVVYLYLDRLREWVARRRRVQH
ncbi:drug efflux protein [Mycoavidus cysteinexigens]|uniref:Drug efflux protein n=1 Tax=Mycoavidus cysteinexigens TaxID=1553431 RepID=A0A2Z6EWQ1_9BURK|nr:efflux RND transporter permease subunit [Mycoavidus cysteinexigens]BBE09883.1 drug efflux protein [Mycoavidus cysteinexigens]GAM53768.1 cobalt-zinc-cadmium resistance protein CzcA [bacterium endosymbiont of Mortierella elongata FMR23-6]GLR02331.1 multidrug resistance protein MdtC [Mycoavidus cysteinexigens]